MKKTRGSRAQKEPAKRCGKKDNQGKRSPAKPSMPGTDRVLVSRLHIQSTLHGLKADSQRQGMEQSGRHPTTATRSMGGSAKVAL